MGDTPKILVVDDEVHILSSLRRELRAMAVEVIVTTDVNEALSILREQRICVIISDINMPVLNGVELLKRCLGISPDTIRMVLTGSTESSLFQSAVNDAHISTFLLKPWDRSALLLAVKQAVYQYQLKLEKEALQREIVEKNKALENWTQTLEKLVEERTLEVSLTQEATILSLTALTEVRDNETGNHIIRTQNYVKLIAEELAKRIEYSGSLFPHEIDLMYKSAPLHDIGKVGIADHILKKEGKLTDDEYELMKMHTSLGRDAIAKAVAKLGETSFLAIASEIAYSHHEKWDGSGYPQGLKGEDIPLSARIMALADVYDALITQRCYKEKMDHDRAVSIIIFERGKHFQPILVDVFLKLQDEFKMVALNYSE